MVYEVILFSAGSLTRGGSLRSDEPLLEGQQIEHYGQAWRVARIDDHHRPPLVTLRRLEPASATYQRQQVG